MHFSLHAPVIAGTAVVGCAAVLAVTPAAPALQLPMPSTGKAVVALSAFDSPITALVDTSKLALNYLFTSSYSSDPVTNWGIDSGVGTEWNDLLPLVHDPYWGFLPHITAVGLIPNFIQVPFPILGQVVNNWISYAQLLFQPGGLATIAADMAVKASAVETAVRRLIAEVTAVLSYQFDVVRAAVSNVITGVTSALAAGDWEGAWNAGVSGLLSPQGIPGTVLNLSIGAGLQTDPADPTTFIPSLRSELQTIGQEMSSALAETAVSSASAVSRVRAVKAARATVPVTGTVTAAAATTRTSLSAPGHSDSTSKPASRRLRAAVG